MLKLIGQVFVESVSLNIMICMGRFLVCDVSYIHVVYIICVIIVNTY